MPNPERPPVDLERLWAPWRAAYVSAARRQVRACIFCFKRLSSAQRRQRLVLYAGPAAVVMLNRYPYNNGHIMVAPRRHLPSLETLVEHEQRALNDLVSGSIGILRCALKPAGFNIGANIGRVAGAGFPGHFHWHIVPRWEGDTNFMPALAATKVISQHLEASFALLSPMFAALKTGAEKK